MLMFIVAAQTRAMTAMDELRKGEGGQTMAEYGFVLSVIAVIVVVAIATLSGGIAGAIDKATVVIK